LSLEWSISRQYIQDLPNCTTLERDREKENEYNKIIYFEVLTKTVKLKFKKLTGISKSLAHRFTLHASSVRQGSAFGPPHHHPRTRTNEAVRQECWRQEAIVFFSHVDEVAGPANTSKRGGIRMKHSH
jgi:hypothetical protein